MRTTVTPAIALTVLTLALPAAAQHYDSGSVILSAERLSGFTHTRNSFGNADRTSEHFSLMGTLANTPADLPRIGLDVFVANHLSIGGTLMYDHRPGPATVAGFGSDAAVTDFLFAPRIGYLVMFSRVFGFWPRGGFSYFHESADPFDAHYWALNLEAPFVIDFTGGFGMTIGPTLDVSLDGSYDPTANGPSTDISYLSYGLEAGLLGWL
jgi:hypothetical protein